MIQFPVVYFGTLAAAGLVFGPTWYQSMPSWKRHMQSTFPAASVAPLATVALSLMLLVPLIASWKRMLKERYFSSLAVSWAGLEKDSPKHEKFVEQAWLAVHYGLMTVLEIFVLIDKPWFPPVLYVENQRAISAPQAEREADQADAGLRIVYTVQLAFYVLEFATLVRARQRRSDYVVYFFHHVYTVLLLAGSWVSFHHRIGSLVLFLHDVGDIWLPIGKCYSYAEDHIRATCTPTQFKVHQAIGTSFFVLFIIFFAIPRLFFFGGLIFQGFQDYKWYSCCGVDYGTCGSCTAGPAWSTGLLALLGLLYPMHVFWMLLIVRMAVRVFVGKYDDVRSDDDDDEPAAADKKRT